MSETDWRKRHDQVLAKASSRPYDPKFGILFDRGQGGTLWDVDGKDYIDLTCGYSATNFGHGFEPFLAAADRQMRRLSHLTGELHAQKIQLAEELVDALVSGPPSQAWRVLFNTGGARAVETAWKAATSFRPGRIVSLAPCFHGNSMATSALSHGGVTVEQVDTSVPHMRQAEQVQGAYPYCNHCPLGLKFPDCSLECSQSLFNWLESNAANISAVIVEPVAAARGYLFPPRDYFLELRRRCSRLGVILIADEIQSGLGRCGAVSVARQQGWQPDIVIVGKSLGGGIVPISACIGRAEILNSLPAASVSETFSGTPIACAVAREVLRQLEAGDWVKRGSALGQHLRDLLAETTCQSDELTLGKIDGHGAVCTLEMRSQGRSIDEAQGLAAQIAWRCTQAGLLVHLAGQPRTRIVMLPPLVLTASELDLVTQRWRAAWLAVHSM